MHFSPASKASGVFISASLMTATQCIPTAARPFGADAAIRVDVVDDLTPFTNLRSEWNQLLANSQADCLFLTWEWLHTWWKHLGNGRRLFVITVRRGDQLIALAPLAIRRTWPARISIVEFLGTGSVGSDYLDFIIHRAFEPAALDAVIRFLDRTGLTLRLPSVKEDSNVASLAVPILADLGWSVRVTPMQVCPFIDFAGGTFDGYLASIGSSNRYNFRRRLRNLQKLHEVRFDHASSDEERRRALQHVIDLHLGRWAERGGSDAFHETGLITFHHEFSALAHERGWLRLRVLKVDGKTVGAFYGFRYADKYSFYQSGFDQAFSRHSVGLVTLGLTIKEAIDEGAAEYDFLHGDESYKFLWTREVRPLFRYDLYPSGVLGRLQRDSAAAVAITKKVIKRALQLQRSNR